MVTETEVLVVGGGLVGLAASAFLAQHGTGVVVAERHASTARHPKARLVNVPSIQRQNRWLAGYAGLGGDGAALVRPDGVVAVCRSPRERRLLGGGQARSVSVAARRA